jgi:hypothetical protein
MTHTVRESGPSQYTLTVEVPTERVESRMLDVARVFQRQVAIPGFRKGKVPLDTVRKEYAAEIEKEFLDRFIPEAVHEVLQEASLVAIVPPSVPNLRFTPGQPLSFELVVDTAPKVEVKDWKGYPLKRRIRKVEAAQVELHAAAAARGVGRVRGRVASRGRRRCRAHRRAAARCQRPAPQGHAPEGCAHPARRAGAAPGPAEGPARRRGGAGAHRDRELPGRLPADGHGGQAIGYCRQDPSGGSSVVCASSTMRSPRRSSGSSRWRSCASASSRTSTWRTSSVGAATSSRRRSTRSCRASIPWSCRRAS